MIISSKFELDQTLYIVMHVHNGDSMLIMQQAIGL